MRPQSQHHEGAPVRRDRRSVASAITLALVAACGPDPEGKFGEYVDEADDLAPKMDIPPPKEDIPPPPPDFDLSGKALLAISTTVSTDLPLQFITTVTQRQEPNGDIFIDIALQPLSLEIGAVTTPREPVGTVLEFKDIQVVDGKYTIDAGETMVVGAANPITGSDITATLVMAAEIRDADFSCGQVTGMVTAPLMTTIDGSTFAAVRITDENDLPTDVTINCNKDTVTDM